MRRIFFISVPYFYNFKSDGGGSSTDQWVIIVEIFRHAPNARPEAAWAALGASAGAAVAGPVEIFRHAPNATPTPRAPPCHDLTWPVMACYDL